MNHKPARVNGKSRIHQLDYQEAPKESKFNATFRRIASASSAAVGSKWAFIIAVTICLVWAATGPLFGFSENWQLVINTGTTIITFLMVFLIQNTQNRDSKAIHLKLDELIRGVKGARTNLVSLEGMSDEEMDDLRKQFEHVRDRAARHADQANEKAEVAQETSEVAHETAKAAHATARQAREVADDAHQDAERAVAQTKAPR